MKRRDRNHPAIILSVLLVLSGCVEVHQVVKMNRDGSGTLTERVRVLPRAVRLLKGYQARTGQAMASFSLVSQEALQNRLRAFGEVTLKKTETRNLPDGGVEIESVMEFKDVNKVRLWMVPTFANTDAKKDGRLGMQYRQLVRGHDTDTNYYRMDLLNIRFSRHPAQAKFSSPSVLEEYRRVTPIFLDMLKDFRLEIQIQAPDDLENFEDAKMVNGMVAEKNRVTVYRVHGENVVANPELIRSFITGEVGGRSDAWGGDWRPMERALRNTYTPYGSDYNGMSVQFAKRVRVSGPGDLGDKK